MGAEPRRAQNYIPISGRGRRPSEPQRFKTEGNLAIQVDRIIQKPANRKPPLAENAPRVHKKLYTSRIEETPGKKMQASAHGQKKGTAAAQQQRKMPTQQQRNAAVREPVRQRDTAVRQPVQQKNAMMREQHRQEPVARQKSTAQGYRSMMHGGSVSMRGEMAIPMPHVKIKPEKPQAQTGVQTAARPAGLVSTILLIVFVFGILSFLLIRNAAISNISLENANIQKNITSLSQSLDKVKLDVTMQDDLNTIRQRAEQLNMGNPGSGQTTYLPKEDTAAIDTAAAADTPKTDSSGDTSFSLNSLFKEIKSLFG